MRRQHMELCCLLIIFTVFLTTLTIRITKAENTISKPYTANISNIKRLLFMKQFLCIIPRLASQAYIKLSVNVFIHLRRNYS